MRTKVNLNINTLYAINIAAKKLKISRTALIKKLLKCFENSHQKYIAFHINVTYQRREEKGNWKQFHLYLSENEYEIFTDMRKFCKMSLSLIIAHSVKEYLNQILTGKNDSDRKVHVDNYPVCLFPARAFLGKTIYSGYCYVVYWGYPEKLPKIY